MCSFSPAVPSRKLGTSLLKLAQNAKNMSKQVKKVNKIKKMSEKWWKKENMIRKCQQNCPATSKQVKQIFPQAVPKNSPQFLRHEFIQLYAKTWHSNAQSLAHQCVKESSIADGNFPYRPCHKRNILEPAKNRVKRHLGRTHNTIAWENVY